VWHVALRAQRQHLWVGNRRERQIACGDDHIRRRLRAIIVRRKKRPRFLFRHLLARKVSLKAAAGTAYCGKGSWPKSNRPAMTRAYPPAWFRDRVVSLKARWQQLNPPRVSDQLTLAL